MFTGLIRELGVVKSFSGGKLTIEAKHRAGIGDSIAVNGACLTVIKATDTTFTVELSHESRDVLAIENYRGKVHIEPAMRLSDRVEGHIVQGHIDCIGEILTIDKSKTSWDFHIKIPTEFMQFIIPKGSITVDGISLTINDVEKDSFRLTITPHSLQNTLFLNYETKRKVNIETDMFARYIYHMFNKKKSLSWDDIDKINFTY